MKNGSALLVSLAIFSLFWLPKAQSAQAPIPFGLEIGKASYDDALEFVQMRKWKYQEYEKKQFKEIRDQDPNRGKNTFLRSTPRDMEGARSMMLFFNSESTLDALILFLDPDLFEVVIEELDKKYELVRKSLLGESPSVDYPSVLWQQGNVYIELQKPSPTRMRLVYVNKLLYENYKDFLKKSYESYRRKQVRKEWMKDL